MSARMYYTDSYTVAFDAKVVEQERVDPDGRVGVVLDRTYFYPNSGGQPADSGTLNKSKVLDVWVRESDGAIVHVLSDTLDGEKVHGEIDWERRFDHMQQHTGQHILSRSFIELYDSDTVGFHLSPDNCTIDLNRATFSDMELAAAERLANQIIWENRAITTRFVSLEEAAELPLRKRPEVQSDQMRLVDIANFDLNACGGTHVRHAGEVGMIKILRTEKRKKNTRLEFCCGMRALRTFEVRHQYLNDVSKELTTGPELAVKAIQKLKAESKDLKKKLKSSLLQLLRAEVEQIKGQGQAAGRGQPIQLYTYCFAPNSWSIGDLRTMASGLTKDQRSVALLAVAGEKSGLVFKRSSDLEDDMRHVLEFVLSAFGKSASGGGSPDFVQGGGVPATEDELVNLLEATIKTFYPIKQEGVLGQ